MSRDSQGHRVGRENVAPHDKVLAREQTGVYIGQQDSTYNTLFKASRDVTQGGSLSPTVFNLIVDTIIREWERHLIKKGWRVGNMRRLFACFYTDGRLLAARKPKHVQLVFNLLPALFDRVGL